MDVVAVRAVLFSSAAVVDHACILCLFIQHWCIYHMCALENTKYTSPSLLVMLGFKFDSEAFVLIYMHADMELFFVDMIVLRRS